LNCPACHTAIADDSDFCPSCGKLLIDPKTVTCERHDTRPAIAGCIICSTPVCEKCVRMVDGRAFCTDHADVHVEQGWALVYSSNEISDAELAKTVLVEAGFKVVVRDFLPIGYVWDGAGDSSFSRLALKKPAKVFVQVEDYLGASEALDDWSGGGT
jgi:RNA polymerase subunit RPABC4/transcription elongation factor Spt4